MSNQKIPMSSNNESGRSLIEMLGVLAVIGVLSVTGIMGFNNAMDKNRANTIINEAQKRAVLIAPQMQIISGTNPILNGFENKIIGGLRKLGFDYVFSSSFGSDLLVLEESTEFIEKLSKKKDLPFFTSSCPAWVKYAEIYHPEIIDNISNCKNPIEMQNELIKKYFADKKGFDSKKLVSVSISNCSARRMEKVENELDTDFYITANELALLLTEEEIDLKYVENSKYDEILGETSGSGYLLSVSGGHLEALIRTIYRIINNKELGKEEIDIYELRGDEDIREATIQMNTFKLKVAVVSDMNSLEKLLKNDNYKKYHLIEVSYCKGGCINGGGQPLFDIEERKKIVDSMSVNIYQYDKKSKNRFAYNNRELMDIYKKLLKKPSSDESKNMFFTEHKNRSILLK